MSQVQEAKTEQQRKQQEAKAELDALIATSAPKNLREGLGSGLSNVVAGAVGAVGVAILAPTIGLAAGAKRGGIIGGTLGLAGGAVVGAVGAAAMAVGGVVQGTTQVVRGVAAVPAAIVEPRKGKWWNESEGKWIYTNLQDEAKALENIPKDDNDILGEAKKDIEKSISGKPDSAEKREVKETFYYDVLGIDPSAEQPEIKRQYYVLARKYHPDKVGKDDKEAADKFKDIAEAYQVLSDPELRAKYDKEGRGGLSADKTEAAERVQIDPALLFAFLFGSDKFNDYIGRLSMATSAAVGDSPKIGWKEARTIQKRRCTRLAIILAEKLQPWTGEDYELAKTMWTTEAAELSKASFGSELVHLIGKVYCLAAVQFLGSLDSGVGLPSVSKWAKSHHAAMKRSHDVQKGKMDTVMAGMKLADMSNKASIAMRGATTDEEKAAVEEKLKKDMNIAMMQLMWKVTVVDITNTLHETVQMVLFDQSVDKETRKRRAHGIKNLGEIFVACPVTSDQPPDVQHLYEEAAFAAMLETIKQKDEAAQAAAPVA